MRFTRTVLVAISWLAVALVAGCETSHTRTVGAADKLEQRIDAAGDRDIALPAPDRAASHVSRDDGRRARRVDRDARSMEVEFVRHAVRDDAERVAGAGMQVVGGAAVVLNVGVVKGRSADKHRRIGAAQPIGGDAGVAVLLLSRSTPPL